MTCAGLPDSATETAAATCVRLVGSVPVCTASIFANEEPEVLNVTVPLLSAVQLHHNEWLGALCLMSGSPVSVVAKVLVAWSLTDVPVSAIRFVK